VRSGRSQVLNPVLATKVKKTNKKTTKKEIMNTFTNIEVIYEAGYRLPKSDAFM
jgi:hypothetical protein